MPKRKSVRNLLPKRPALGAGLPTPPNFRPQMSPGPKTFGRPSGSVRRPATAGFETTRSAPVALPRRTPVRRGFSFLELQVAFVLFGIALAGLGPLVVMQSRQLQQLEARFDEQTTYYLVPSTDTWAQRLGAAASVQLEDPGPPPSPPATLIDNGDPGYSEIDLGTADWITVSRERARNGSLRLQGGSGVGDTAIWEFSGLDAGWYHVLATWDDKGGQATDAPYTVYDGTEPLGTVRVNQAQDPSEGNNFEWLRWESLGVFSIETDTLRVELTDDANGDIAADAVRIVPVRNEVQILSLDKSLTSEDVTAHVSITVQVP